MEKDINNLTNNIKDLIKKFSQGKLSVENTEKELIELEKQYQELKKDKTNEINDNYLDGICYYHNIENFCIYSAFYCYSNKYFRLLSYYGDEIFHKKIIYILQKNIYKINQDEVFEIKPESERNLNNNLYIKIKINSDGKIFIFTALSSSRFFTKEKFNFVSDFIIKLLPDFNFSQFSYLNKLADIEKEINMNKELSAYIFHFEDLLNIFGHMGKFDLEIITKIIKETINKKFNNSFISILSYTDYVVLNNDEKMNENKLKTKLNFYYKDIPIPYILKCVKLEGDNRYLKFTESLFSLTN